MSRLKQNSVEGDGWRYWFSPKFIGSNVLKGLWNAIGTLIVYGIVAWLIIRHGWAPLKDAISIRAMAMTPHQQQQVQQMQQQEMQMQQMQQMQQRQQRHEMQRQRQQQKQREHEEPATAPVEPVPYS